MEEPSASANETFLLALLAGSLTTGMVGALACAVGVCVARAAHMFRGRRAAREESPEPAPPTVVWRFVTHPAGEGGVARSLS